MTTAVASPEQVSPNLEISPEFVRGDQTSPEYLGDLSKRVGSFVGDLGHKLDQPKRQVITELGNMGLRNLNSALIANPSLLNHEPVQSGLRAAFNKSIVSSSELSVAVNDAIDTIGGKEPAEETNIESIGRITTGSLMALSAVKGSEIYTESDPRAHIGDELSTKLKTSIDAFETVEFKHAVKNSIVKNVLSAVRKQGLRSFIQRRRQFVARFGQ